MTVVTKKEAARAVNEVWKYDADGLIDTWSFTTTGDCDDYAMSILKELFGTESKAKAALRNHHAYIWYAVTDNNKGHAVLEFDGEYIDNRTRHWVSNPDDLEPCKLKWRYPWLWMALRIALG